MRKKIKFITIVIIVGLFGVLIFSLLSKVMEKTTIQERIKTVPAFTLKTINNTEFENNNLTSNMPTVFLYFNSECDFCQHEAESISNRIDEFNKIQLVFVSTEPIEKIKEFSEKYNLHKHINIIFLQDAIGNFSEQFNATTIPYTLAYDKNQKLIKTHKGQINAKGILKIFDKE